MQMGISSDRGLQMVSWTKFARETIVREPGGEESMSKDPLFVRAKADIREFSFSLLF